MPWLGLLVIMFWVSAAPAASAFAAGGAEPVGQDIYVDNCARCHGTEGEGIDGPKLVGKELRFDRVVRIVTQGRDDMPSWEDDLSEDEIRRVADYVTVLSGGTGAPSQSVAVTAGSGGLPVPPQDQGGSGVPPWSVADSDAGPVDPSVGMWVGLIALALVAALETLGMLQDRRNRSHGPSSEAPAAQ